MSDPDRHADSAVLSGEFVTFMVGEEMFAVPLGEVKEIIRMPSLVQAPLSPPSLAGLANLRGQVLPVVRLRRVLAMAEGTLDDATRVIVVDRKQPIGLIVDRIRAVTSVPAERIESLEGLRTTIDADLLRGIVKDDAAVRVTMILAVEALLAREFGHLGKVTDGQAQDRPINARLSGPSAAAVTGTILDSERQLVSFLVDGQEYALPIQDVQEIVQRPDKITLVPGGNANVLGVMTLRDRILPLVSLHAMFGLAEPETDARSRVVVVGLRGDAGSPTSKGARIGLTTDSVRDVLRVATGSIEPTPLALACSDGMAEIEAFCRLDGGKRLVAILSTQALLQRGALEHLAHEKDQGMTDASDSDDERQFVVFRLMDEEYGVPIQAVQEIVRIPEALTRLPKAPDFVEGVVNLRGSVLPVIDNRRRLGLPPVARNERQRIMVFAIKGVRTGFIVDAVTEVIRIKERCISPSPALSLEQRDLFKEIAKPDGKDRMILLLDPDRLLNSVQIDEVRQVAA